MMNIQMLINIGANIKKNSHFGKFNFEKKTTVLAE